MREPYSLSGVVKSEEEDLRVLVHQPWREGAAIGKLQLELDPARTADGGDEGMATDLGWSRHRRTSSVERMIVSEGSLRSGDR